MQIKKEVTFDITAKEVNEFLKECLNDKDKLSEFVDGMNLGVMSYIAAKYVNRLAKDDPYSYEKFVEFLPKSIKLDEKTEPKKSDIVKEQKKPKFNVGDSFKCHRTLVEELSPAPMFIFVDYIITVINVTTNDFEHVTYTMESNFGEKFYVTDTKLLKWMKEEKIVRCKQLNVRIK